VILRPRPTGRRHVVTSTPGRRALAVVLGVVLLIVAAQTLLFVLPAGDRPQPADAIVVLAGPGPRIERGEELARARLAPEVLLMVQTATGGCTVAAPARPHCVEPNPRTTQGEARAVARLAEEHGWRSLLVVVQNEQAVRAEIRLDRCLDPEIEVRFITVRGNLGESLLRTVYESGALPKALLLQRDC
jgi:uncharacterized SAM-binding protein YcdF (DUF218 family)